MASFSHVDSAARPTMVDVGDKSVTKRTATASTRVRFPHAVAQALRDQQFNTPKGPVFPLYEPPKGFSPAAAHHVYYRGLRDHSALIATLMNLAVKGRVKIDTSRKGVTGFRGPGSGDAPDSGHLPRRCS